MKFSAHTLNNTANYTSSGRQCLTPSPPSKGEGLYPCEKTKIAKGSKNEIPRLKFSSPSSTTTSRDDKLVRIKSKKIYF